MAQKKSMQFDTPKGGYNRLMPFNRFNIERVDGFVVLHFGFINAGGILLDKYSTAITNADLEGHRESLLSYLGKLGSLEDAPPTWQPPAGACAIEMFNHVGVTSNAEAAELTLNYVIIRAVTEMQNKGTGGQGPIQAVAVLRSAREVQKHLIRELYPLK